MREESLKVLEKEISLYRDRFPDNGLPEDIFFFTSRITPIVNVDLLIQDEDKRTLLAWRNSFEWEGEGWHIPGGIVRYKEGFEDRLLKVSEMEIGTQVEFEKAPIALNEVILPQETRGHFVSILYKCFLSRDFVLSNSGVNCHQEGYLKWHEGAPTNLLKCQDIYRKHF